VQALQASQKQQGMVPRSASLLLAIESREWAHARELIASGADVNTWNPRVGYMLKQRAIACFCCALIVAIVPRITCLLPMCRTAIVP
jgi:hypothetical protein